MEDDMRFALWLTACGLVLGMLNGAAEAQTAAPGTQAATPSQPPEPQARRCPAGWRFEEAHYDHHTIYRHDRCIPLR
jgi:hypothetical protein